MVTTLKVLEFPSTRLLHQAQQMSTSMFNVEPLLIRPCAQINLVAAQLVLDREHANRIVFNPEDGLDPLVDLRLRGAQVLYYI